MIRVGRYWACGEHDPPETISIPASGPIGPGPSGAGRYRFDRLPSVLAIPLRDFVDEAHPVMRLHRLCDAVEILTRFCCIVELGELRRGLADQPFPEALAHVLREQIERPTLGQWKNLLMAAAEGLARSETLVVPELRAFALGDLIPGLERGPSAPGEERGDSPGLIGLRNNLVHGGAMSRSEAGRQLGTWEPWLERAVGRLDFLAEAELCHLAEGRARLLMGTGSGPEVERPLPSELRAALPGLDRHVVLIRAGHWVDLWPLCDFGRAEKTSRSGPVRAPSDSPLVYIRAERDRLLFAALGAEFPHSENRAGDVLAQFRALFSLRDGRPREAGESPDFEGELRLDSAGLVGRVEEIERAIALLKQAQSGILWLGGPGGIGKSFFTARLATDPRLVGDRKKICRIAWRFRSGDRARCDRWAFFRHAVARLEEWLHDDRRPVAADDLGSLSSRLQGLLDEAAEARPGPHPGARAPRVIFLIDGLDEIVRADPEFASVPFQLARANVVWFCSGRPEADLSARFAPGCCTHVFPGGLPRMSDADIRGMLLMGSDRLKYDLLRLDREGATPEGRATVTNPAVEQVVSRAGGLPLYVRLVVQDLLAGEHDVGALDRLPPGLVAYYDELLRRPGIGEVQAVLTPVIATIAWACSPLDDETLHLLMARRRLFLDPEKGRSLIRRALDASGAILRLAPVPGGDRWGYEAYHPTLRDHIRSDPAGIIGEQNALAREALASLVGDWERLPLDHPARDYALRDGPRTLAELGSRDALVALLLDLKFLEAKSAAGLAHHLVLDLESAAAPAPGGPDRNPALTLLARAFRAEVARIDRRPPGLFQYLWNRGRWYEEPDAFSREEYPGAAVPEGPGFSALLERWRAARLDEPGFVWVRSLLPPIDAGETALRHLLRDHADPVTAVAFSADGRLLASGDEEGFVRVWDVSTGIVRGNTDAGFGAVDQILLDPDGEAVGIVRGRREVEWLGFDGPAAAREPQRTQEGVIKDSDPPLGWKHWRFFRALAKIHWKDDRNWSAVSRDGLRMVIRGIDGLMRVTDVKEREEFARFTDGERPDLMALALSDGGTRIALITGDAGLTVLDGKDGHERASVALGLARFVGGPRAIQFTPEGSRVIAGLDDGSVRVVEVDKGRERLPIRHHHGPVRCIAIDGQGRFASGADDRMIHLYDAHGERLDTFRGHSGRVDSLAFSPDGGLLASASHDETVRIWDLAGRRVETASPEPPADIRCLAFSPDGRLLATGGSDGSLVIRAAREGRRIGRARDHDGAIEALEFSPDSRQIATATEDGSIRLWDAGSLEIRATFPAPPGPQDPGESPPPKLEFAAGGRLLGYNGRSGFRLVGLDGEVVPDGFLRPRVGVRDFAFAEAAPKVAVAIGGADVEVWDLERWDEPIAIGWGTAAIHCVALTLDGLNLGTGGADGCTRIWHIPTGRLRACHLVFCNCFKGYGSLMQKTKVQIHPIERVAFSPDGLRILASSGDGGETMRAWSVGPSHFLKWMSISALDLAGAAADDARSRWLAYMIDDRSEASIISAPTFAKLARHPLRCGDGCRTIRVHPGGRLWAAFDGSELHLFALEGPDELRIADGDPPVCPRCGERCGPLLTSGGTGRIGAGCFARQVEARARPGEEKDTGLHCWGCRLPIKGPRVDFGAGPLCEECVVMGVHELARIDPPLSWGEERIDRALDGSGPWTDRLTACRSAPGWIGRTEDPARKSSRLRSLVHRLDDDRHPLDRHLRDAAMLACLAIGPEIAALVAEGLSEQSSNESLYVAAWLTPDDPRIRAEIERRAADRERAGDFRLARAVLPHESGWARDLLKAEANGPDEELCLDARRILSVWGATPASVLRSQQLAVAVEPASWSEVFRRRRRSLEAAIARAGEGRFAEAGALFEEVLECDRRMGDLDREFVHLELCRAQIPEDAFREFGFSGAYIAGLERAAEIAEAIQEPGRAARLRLALGKALEAERRFPEAKAAYARALDDHASGFERDEERKALAGLGRSSQAIGDHEGAIEAFKRALRKTRFGQLEVESRLRSDLALSYRTLGRWKESLEEEEKALACDRSLGHLGWQRHDLVQIGQCLRKLGRSEEALVPFEEALQLAIREANRAEEALRLTDLGDCCEDLARWEQAEGYHARALEAYSHAPRRDQQEGNLAREYGAHVAIARCLRALEDHGGALGHYERALEIARGLGDRDAESARLSDVGACLEDLGRHGEAIRLHEAALALDRDRDDRAGISFDLVRLGRCHRAIGDGPGALPFFESALAMAVESKDEEAESLRLSDLGDCYKALGRSRVALGYYERALLVDRRRQARFHEACDLLDLSCCREALGDLATASDLCRRAIAIASSLGEAALEGRGWMSLGIVLIQLGDVVEAEKALAAALERLDDPAMIAVVLAARARLHLQRGRQDDAVRDADEALRVSTDPTSGRPEFYPAHVAAQVRLVCGDLLGAREAARLAMEASPTPQRPMSESLLGLVLHLSGDREAAHRMLVSAVQGADAGFGEEPDDYENHDWKGLALVGLLAMGEGPPRSLIAEAFRWARARTGARGVVMRVLQLVDRLDDGRLPRWVRDAAGGGPADLEGGDEPGAVVRPDSATWRGDRDASD